MDEIGEGGEGREMEEEDLHVVKSSGETGEEGGGITTVPFVPLGGRERRKKTKSRGLPVGGNETERERTRERKFTRNVPYTR